MGRDRAQGVKPLRGPGRVMGGERLMGRGKASFPAAETAQQELGSRAACSPVAGAWGPQKGNAGAEAGQIGRASRVLMWTIGNDGMFWSKGGTRDPCTGKAL